MIHLKPITPDNINDFAGTSYETMPLEQKQKMIEESRNNSHNGFYFEVLVVYKNDEVMGFVNLYAHSKHIISCGPEIKKKFQNNGLGTIAETMALAYAKDKGYTIAVGYVDKNSTASIALHEKLGFESDRTYSNKTKRTIRLYLKAL